MHVSAKRPEHILMATDLGPASASAFRFAGSLAKATGARLTVFHAIAPLLVFDFGGWDPHSFILAAENERSKALTEIFQLCIDELDDSVNVSVEVRECNPVQGIVKLVNDAACDLIVLGTHAWGPVASLFLGSVAQGVVHESDVPVVMVRAGVNDAFQLRSVLCPVDSSAAAHAAAEHASMLAEATGAELRLLDLAGRANADQAAPAFEWQPGSISMGTTRNTPSPRVTGRG